MTTSLGAEDPGAPDGVERRVPTGVGEESVWVDSVSVRGARAWAWLVKYIDPAILGTGSAGTDLNGLPPLVAQRAGADLDDELRRIRDAVVSPTTPLVGLRLITNTDQGAAMLIRHATAVLGEDFPVVIQVKP